MAPPATCCVCGSKAELQCSACARADVQLYFCSPVHQKLVWFAHKPVCGPGKADLRKLPDVSTAELEICRMPSFQQALASPSGGYIYLLATSVEGGMHLPPGSFAQHAPHLKEWLSTQPPPRRQNIQITLAAAINDFARTPASWPSTPLSLPPWLFAHGLECCITGYVPNMSRRERLALFHRCAIWAGLMNVLAGKVPDPAQSVTVRHVTDALRSLLLDLESHPLKNPKVAARQLGAIFSNMLAAVPSTAEYCLTVVPNPDKPDHLLVEYTP